VTARYTVFFCPDDLSALAEFGNRVLGRLPTGQRVSTSAGDFTDRVTAELLASTPAHYGFHATLKAPFELAENFSSSDFLAHVEQFAKQQQPITLHDLKPRALAGFMALAFEMQPIEVVDLACRCVEEFEPYRAELSQIDLDKRKPELLTEQQRDYLYRFGYPFVMQEFRFHMTLTGKFNVSEHTDYIAWLTALYDTLLSDPPVLDRLAIFWQPDRQTAFARIAQFPFS